jgi:uncharacterized protein (TIGR03437 family)
VNLRLSLIVAAGTAACCLVVAQDGEAPGSLISIRGFRFGGPSDTTLVRIRHGERYVETAALAVHANEIQALVPENTPLGSAVLQVVRNGHASLEWPIEIIESSFGAFSRNGDGWDPGEISNANGVRNLEAHPAMAGETVTITGTGLGLRVPDRAPPQVLVAGHLASGVLRLNRTEYRPGVDTIAFHLPPEAPEGCHVPVQVSSAPGVYSNAVTLAISRDGSPCTDHADWGATFRNQKMKLATVGLIHADIEMGATAKNTTVYPMDAAFASFSEIERDAPVNFLFQFPPVGGCTTYIGTAGLQTIAASFGLLETLTGKLLDAGPSVTIRAPRGEQLLPGSVFPSGRYWSIIGGHSPLPWIQALPLFLKSGDYQISAPGGRDIGPFHTTVLVKSPLIWRNRSQIGQVDRTRGATVTWLPSEKSGADLIVVLALNQDSRSGSLGLCACLAKASAETFHIPAYALANIPPTPEHPFGLPLNMIVLLELPKMPVATGTGTDGTLVFGASLSARTVQFK